MRLFSIVLLLLASSPLLASDYQDQIDTFFELLVEGESDKAVDVIYSSNQFVSSIPDQISQVKTQLAGLNRMVGKLISVERMDTYQVRDKFVHVTYIAIYDRQPIRYEFQFFNVETGWRILSFSFDDDLDDEIEARARARALQVAK